MNFIRAAVTRATVLAPSVQIRSVTKKASPVKKVAAKKASPVKKNAGKSSVEITTPEKKRSASAYALFVKETTTGTTGKLDLKALGAKWQALTEAEKDVFRQKSRKAAAIFKEIKGTKKVTKEKPASADDAPAKVSKYAAFVKEHFHDAYAVALKKTADKKEAFKLATKSVAEKYKAHSK